MKIKVVEAMGYGKAVVTTSVGAEGIGIAGTEACAVAEAADIPALLAQLLGDKRRLETMGAAARTLALQQYSAAAWQRRVNDRLGLMVPRA